MFALKKSKIKKFWGRKGEQSMYDFIEDITHVLKTPTSDEEKINFLVNHLDDPANE